MKNIEGVVFDKLKLLTANWVYIHNSRKVALVEDIEGVYYSVEFDYLEDVYYLSEG